MPQLCLPLSPNTVGVLGILGFREKAAQQEASRLGREGGGGRLGGVESEGVAGSGRDMPEPQGGRRLQRSPQPQPCPWLRTSGWELSLFKPQLLCG